jgi:hypothetical protein
MPDTPPVQLGGTYPCPDFLTQEEVRHAARRDSHGLTAFRVWHLEARGARRKVGGVFGHYASNYRVFSVTYEKAQSFDAMGDAIVQAGYLAKWCVFKRFKTRLRPECRFSKPASLGG